LKLNLNLEKNKNLDKKKPWLLVVEDDQENQKFLRIFLRKIFEVDVCDSAESFYEKININLYDIILMDISLRGAKDGLQLTRELRSQEKYKNMPIVGLSAHAFQKDRDNALQAGIDIFITKPTQGSFLQENLIAILKQKSGITIN
jgi:two-component system, sensor histidine kinase and response regulator